MYWLYAITGLAFVFSAIASREKTLQVLKISYQRFINILPAFLIMLILVSVVLFLLPDYVISNYLGVENKFNGVLLASFLGSITLMPGFIAFPLAAILLKKGVVYMVLSAFTTTLMMVGVLTYPIEKQYFGVKVTIIRNAISLLIALIIAVITGIFFGEIF
ncbi:permease [Chloroflexota bacterium]